MNRKLELAKVLLVFIVSTMMLTHGIPKIYNFDGTIAWLQSVLEPTIFPGILAYGVFVGEVVAPVMLLFGKFAR